jgi:ribosomal protein S18 acetylase RimI-like enzyme
MANVMASTDPPLSFRKARSADLEWLLDLRLATMAGYIEASGQRLTLADQHQRVLQDFGSIQIISRGDTDIGMMKVVRHPDVWHLVQIQLLPRFQGAGSGALLIRDLLDSAREAEVPVALSVLKVNPAKRLYEQLGFRVVAETGHSYEMQFDG